MKYTLTLFTAVVLLEESSEIYDIKSRIRHLTNNPFEQYLFTQFFSRGIKSQLFFVI